jgi:hypothetical protein
MANTYSQIYIQTVFVSVRSHMGIRNLAQLFITFRIRSTTTDDERLRMST